MFLHVCVILFTGGGLSGQPPRDLAGRTPLGSSRENNPPPRTWQGETPQDLAGRTPPRDLAGRTPPGPGMERTPPRDLAGRTPPPTRQTPPRDLAGRPPREEDCSIQSMSGRYASYWNAFLFLCCFYVCVQLLARKFEIGIK